MHVIKYPQSCLVVETAGARLLVDPGVFVTAKYEPDDLGEIDAVLYTHRHADHVDPELATSLRERGVELFGNTDVCALLEDVEVTEIVDGQTFTAAGVEVRAHDLPHVELVDGSAGPPNTGYLVAGHLFHPGDGLELTGLRAPAVAAPISGPSISFRDAYRFVQQVGAERVVPIHYDLFTADPEHFARVCDIAEVVPLRDGERTEV
jgi:L-ascorbate metabolism protein UlaG (beta-lactamase superfamily)